MARRPEELADILFPEEPSEESHDILNIPPRERRLHTETYDFAVSTIVDYLNADRICIPEFQRRYVWTQAQASRLIESLIIQCPIPIIYLNQQADERLSVIDGNQRLQSIRNFVQNRFKLRGLTTYPELSGLHYHELDPRFQRHIMNRTLRCILIMKDTHPQVKFDVFERLNSGSVQINAQELRHGLYHGPLMELIEKLAKDKIWLDALGLKKDTRMKAEELALRFLALYHNGGNYKKPLVGFLNDFAETYRKLDKDTEERFRQSFASATAATLSLFGKQAYRMLDVNGHSNGGLNAAIFDAEMISLADFQARVATLSDKERHHAVLQYAALMNAPEFSNSVLKATSDEQSVRRRLDQARLLARKLFG